MSHGMRVIPVSYVRSSNSAVATHLPLPLRRAPIDQGTSRAGGRVNLHAIGSEAATRRNFAIVTSRNGFAASSFGRRRPTSPASHAIPMRMWPIVAAARAVVPSDLMPSRRRRRKSLRQR